MKQAGLPPEIRFALLLMAVAILAIVAILEKWI